MLGIFMYFAPSFIPLITAVKHNPVKCYQAQLCNVHCTMYKEGKSSSTRTGNCRADLEAMAENGHAENGAAAPEKRKADDTENGENGANGAKREKVTTRCIF